MDRGRHSVKNQITNSSTRGSYNRCFPTRKMVYFFAVHHLLRVLSTEKKKRKGGSGLHEASIVWGGGGCTIMRQERRPFCPIGRKIAGRVSVFQFVHGVICALPHLDIDALLAPREGRRQRRCASLLVRVVERVRDGKVLSDPQGAPPHLRHFVRPRDGGKESEPEERLPVQCPSALKHKPSSYQEGDCHHHRPLVSGFVHFQCCWLHCC